MMFDNAKILLFAKAPIPGKVKTRLMPELSAIQAADIHQQLFHHVMNKMQEIKLAPVEIWADSGVCRPVAGDRHARRSR